LDVHKEKKMTEKNLVITGIIIESFYIEQLKAWQFMLLSF